MFNWCFEQSNISRGGSWNLNGFTVFCTMFDVKNPLLNMVSLTSAGAIPVADGRINPRFLEIVLSTVYHHL